MHRERARTERLRRQAGAIDRDALAQLQVRIRRRDGELEAIRIARNARDRPDCG
jgi:hypothetical protein